MFSDYIHNFSKIMYLNEVMPPHNDTRADSDEPNSNPIIICPNGDNKPLNSTDKTSKKRFMASQSPEYIRNSNSRTSKQIISTIQGMVTKEIHFHIRFLYI